MATRRSLAVAAMVAMVLGLAAGGADATMYSHTDKVLTPGGLYQGDTSVLFPIGVVVMNVQLIPSAGAPTYNPPDDGDTIIVNSFFDIFAEVSLDGGATFGPMAVTSVPTTVRFTNTGNPDLPPEMGASSYDTEMLSLDISGGTFPPGVMIRESPTLASLGYHYTALISGGIDKIVSFFDIFTELSVDGGQTWMPAQGLQGPSYMHVVMTPEPATMALLGLGSLVALIRRRRGA